MPSLSFLGFVISAEIVVVFGCGPPPPVPRCPEVTVVQNFDKDEVGIVSKNL